MYLANVSALSETFGTVMLYKSDSKKCKQCTKSR